MGMELIFIRRVFEISGLDHFARQDAFDQHADRSHVFLGGTLQSLVELWRYAQQPRLSVACH